jgi:feruloyl esterase
MTSLDLSVVSAELVRAAGDIPEYCRVTAQALPQLQMEFTLPTAWSRRLLMGGNGGFAGERFDGPPRDRARGGAVKRGFVYAISNTGHDGFTDPGASFMQDRQKLLDYGFRSLHVTAETAKRVASAYYGVEVLHSYYQGCSTGGRQGLILAQRFPKDFDGIVAGAPVLNFTGAMTEFACDAQAFSEAPISLPLQKILAETIYAGCDAKDGVKDGVIGDPRQCDFQPARDLPKCGDGGAQTACFTPGQIHALEKYYADISTGGQLVMPGWPVGAEVEPDGNGGWDAWAVGAVKRSAQAFMSESFFKYVGDGPFDLNKSIRRLETAHKIIDATDTDLSLFQKRGGKLLMYHGWADPALNALVSVRYYEDVTKQMGSGTSDFFRFYLVPGMLHCEGGVGTGMFDTLSAIVEWVEKGTAPDREVVPRTVAGKTVFTRPLCPYPQAAVYKGTGDTNDAASFDCAVPKSLR